MNYRGIDVELILPKINDLWALRVLEKPTFAESYRGIGASCPSIVKDLCKVFGLSEATEFIPNNFDWDLIPSKNGICADCGTFGTLKEFSTDGDFMVDGMVYKTKWICEDACTFLCEKGHPCKSKNYGGFHREIQCTSCYDRFKPVQKWNGFGADFIIANYSCVVTMYNAEKNHREHERGMLRARL